MRRAHRRSVRAGVVLAAMAAAVLGVATPAAAHVTVEPATASAGEIATLTFRVPNEKATASTVRVEIEFPDTTPITAVSVKPVPGWRVETQRQTLDQPVTGVHGEQISDIVARITWSAEPGAEIGPGQFQEFQISAGPLPAADQVVFKALQHYSDGEIVRWIDEPTPGVDLEYPAPVLRLVTAESGAGGAPQSESEGSGAALAFGIAGTVLGLAGLLLGLLAYRRSSR